MSNNSRRTETVTLYEEYRLIEKDESEINLAWRGVHLLLFFLAFVFGSFCTFCFHMLMYLFDDKCVLFPKLISLKEMRRGGGGSGSGSGNKLLYDTISDDLDSLPVDFVSTHWVEKSTCYLPTYAPLLSGICGLIWTTMFLMCSSGSRALTGLQRPWRILPTVFVFSLAMGGLGVYTSFITQAGLEELCTKLGEITGSKSCTYTINVATLAYERRIRGVYQATRLTIMSAWLHTCCWLGAALTALIRVILVVDFRLVKVKVELQGNIEKMLERHEKHIRTDEFSNKDDNNSLRLSSTTSLKVRFVNKGFGTEPVNSELTKTDVGKSKENIHFVSQNVPFSSELSLLPDENRRLSIRRGSLDVLKRHKFIVEALHDIIDSIGTQSTPKSVKEVIKSDVHLAREQGVQNLRSLVWSASSGSGTEESLVNREEAEELAKKFRHHLESKLATRNFQIQSSTNVSRQNSENTTHKSSLKNRGVQTDEVKKATVSQKVQIFISPSAETLLTLKPHEEPTWRESTDELKTTGVSGVKLDISQVRPDRSPKSVSDDGMKSLPDEGSTKTLIDDNKQTSPDGSKKPLTDNSNEPDEHISRGAKITAFLSSLVDSGDTLTIRPKISPIRTQIHAEPEKGNLEMEATGSKGQLTNRNWEQEEPGPSRTNAEKYEHKKITPRKTDKKEKQD